MKSDPSRSSSGRLWFFLKLSCCSCFCRSSADIELETEGSNTTYNQIAKEIADLQLSIRQKQEQQLNFKKNHNLPLDEREGSDFIAIRLKTSSSQLMEAEAERKKLQADIN